MSFTPKPRRHYLFVASGIVAAMSLALLFRIHPPPARVYAAQHPSHQLSADHVAPAEAVPPTEAVAHLDQPDQACAQCHRQIYESYQRTAMARGGGLASENLLPGSFLHKPSGIQYDIFLRDGAAWMSYTRSSHDPRDALSGERQLQYSIGSATHGRTYLYKIGRQWFELPVNFYAGGAAWAMTPAYGEAQYMPAPLPVDPNCLHCHSTSGQPSLPTARNRFANRPFQQGGVGCRGCHGDPTAHLASNGHAPITNPGKLPVAQRDSACIQCHLEGEAIVYRPGRSLAQFQPGDNLADIAVYFVRTSQRTGGARATSQYEALLQSACRRAVGDKLTCTTCHDPHFEPPPTERVQYFRARCLSCHTAPALATSHFPAQPDCAQCHMPARNTADISHEQVTDHDIEARPSSHRRNAADTAHDPLVPVGNMPAGDREYGLAYAQAAQRGVRGAAETALHLLNKAAQAGSSDEELNRRLGYLNQISGNQEEARRRYKLTLEANPYEPTALANLAVLDVSSGSPQHMTEGLQLLERLLNADPSQTKAGLNLAFIECKLGHRPEAVTLLQQLATYNPDDPQLREFLDHGNFDGQHCSLTAK